MASVYLAGCLVVYAAALLLARAVLQARLAEAAAFALNATYGGVAYVAMPVVVAAFGANGLALILPIIALHSGIILPLAAALIEIGSRDGGRFRPATLLRGLLRNPIVASIGLGFLWHAAALPVPDPLHGFLALLAKAAPGLALFCVGASLPAVSRGFAREAALAAGLKLAVLPATIGGLALFAGVSGLPLKVALIAAAMPTGANAFLVAKRAAAASAAIVVVTLAASLPLLCGLLAALGR